MSLQKILPPSILPDIFSEDSSTSTKKKISLFNVCFLGHVDAGKSTTVSQILVSDKRVSDHLISQFEKEAQALDKASFKFAWLLDQNTEERNRGITISLGHVEFGTPNRYFTIIDAPGHEDFTKNAIVGTSQADLVVLVVDSKKGLLEAKQTEQHAIIARASGINSCIVALTKVDLIPVEQRQKVIEQRKAEVSELLLNCGFSPERTLIVPVDSYNNVNISTQERNKDIIPFYTGPTLVEALDTIPIDVPDDSLPFRLSVQNVYTRIGGTNCVVTGKVMSGKVQPKDKVVIKPSNVIATVGGIEMHHKKLSYAPVNANIGIDLKGVKPEDLDKASIICHVDDRPAKAIQQFTVEKAVIKSHPTRLTVGSNVIIHFQTGNVCAKIKALENCFSIAEKKLTPGNVESVAPGCLVDITFVPDRPVVLEPKSDHPKNCKILIRESNKNVGWGSVSKVVYSKFEI